MVVTVYSDASRCLKTGVSGCSYVILVGEKMVQHRVWVVDGLPTSQKAEEFALIHGMQDAYLLDGVSVINVHSDCLILINLMHHAKRKKVKTKYAELFDTMEIIKESGIKLNAFHVLGHSTNTMNNLVDKSSRTQLREYLKSIP